MTFEVGLMQPNGVTVTRTVCGETIVDAVDALLSLLMENLLNLSNIHAAGVRRVDAQQVDTYA